MPYNKFTLKTLISEFNLTLVENVRLFPNVQPASPSDLLLALLEDNVPLATAIDRKSTRRINHFSNTIRNKTSS